MVHHNHITAKHLLAKDIQKMPTAGTKQDEHLQTQAMPTLAKRQVAPLLEALSAMLSAGMYPAMAAVTVAPAQQSALQQEQR
jgi:hypothetical protein